MRSWFIAQPSLTATWSVSGQVPEAIPEPLAQMIEAERAFAARALVIGWKDAFLEFFAPSAVGFAEGKPGSARDQIAKNPDPPKDLQLIWEPRYGDVSASGELGYLTGPVRNIRASRDGGKPRHSNYASIWKRQRDGSFKVVMDVGINTPSAVPFAAGFTRAPQKNRFTGDYDDSTPPLGTADEVLNSALKTSPLRAYRVATGRGRTVPSSESAAGRRTAGGHEVAGVAAAGLERRLEVLRGGPLRRSRLHLGHLHHRADTHGHGTRPRQHADAECRGGVLRAGLGPRAERPMEGRARRATITPL